MSALPFIPGRAAIAALTGTGVVVLSALVLGLDTGRSTWLAAGMVVAGRAQATDVSSQSNSSRRA